MSNYALVSRSSPLDLGPADEDSNVRTELTSIYESFAELYPNPSLAEERHERDRLLRQIAAENFVSEAPPRKRGMFGFLWGKKETTTAPQVYDVSGLDEEKLLEYVQQEGNEEDSLLCGTQLEVECIPREAYSAARFHLASVKTRRDLPNVARSTEKACSVVVTGVGVIAELQEDDAVPMLTHTSDRDDLVEYIASLDTLHDLSYARAATMGPNLLAVSWGLDDGIIVLYRRMAIPDAPGWEAVAMMSPTRAVLDNLEGSDVFAHDGLASSKLLCVTDIVPLLVESPDSETPVATLAVSRLGGYIELVVLPTRLWRVPVLTPKNHKVARRKRKRRRNEQIEHYCNEKLYHVGAAETCVTALTTFERHVDVLCLEAHRTRVGGDTVWDTDAFPNEPPAEYVLVASGTKDGHEHISFWGISTVFPETTASCQSQDSMASLHVAFVHAIDMGTLGAQASVFASNVVLNHWRKARQVRLRQGEEEQNHEDDEMEQVDEKPEVIDLASSQDEDAGVGAGLQLSTLSTPVPIVRMRLTHSNGASEETQEQQNVLLAALDWNGGVTVIDCTKAMGVATHDVAKETHLESSGPSLSRDLFHRAESLRGDLPGSNLSTVDIGWLSLKDHQSRSSFALVAIKPRILQVWSFMLRQDAEGKGQVSSALQVASMSRGAAAIPCNNSGSLSLATFWRGENKKKTLRYGALQELDSSKIIDLLVKSSKYTEAIVAAEAMNVAGSAKTIQLCHRRLWERTRDVHHLRAVTDDEFVVDEVLAVFDNSGSQATMDLSMAREACYLAIERVSRDGARLTTAVKLGGLEGMEEIKSKLRDTAIKLATYALLCDCHGTQALLGPFREKFLLASLLQLASAFASNGDIPALTILFFRHRRELLRYHRNILDQVPLATPTATFAHLLPVAETEGNESDYFYPGVQKNAEPRLWSLMGRYIESNDGTKMFLDKKDEEIVLSGYGASSHYGDRLEPGSLSHWYLARAQLIQRDIGRISFLGEFCECALVRLGISLSGQGQGTEAQIIELSSLRTFAIHLDEILAGDPIASSSEKFAANALATVGMLDMQKMSVEDRISLILGAANDPTHVLSRLRKCSILLSLGAEEEETHPEDIMDHAIYEYCRKSILGAVPTDDNGRGNRGLKQVNDLRNALGVCTAIANASRSTIRRSKRVIKDKFVLMNLVIDATYNTSRACKSLRLLPSDCRHLIDLMWESYECLPAHLAPDEVSQPNLVSAEAKVDQLYRNLVVIDILSRYAASTALRFLASLNTTAMTASISSETDENDRTDHTTVGVAILSEICRSFCHQISQGRDAGFAEKELDLLTDLMSDVDQLQNVGFEGLLPLASTLQECIVRPLLQQGDFQLIDQLANWIGREKVQAEVLAFVKAAMFNDDESLSSMGGNVNGDRVYAAIQCQDALGPLFPGLHSELDSVRRYLDAASFINTLLPRSDSTEMIYPCEVRDKPPLDIIESVLSRNPACILEGCRDWGDFSFATKANEVIRNHYRQGDIVALSPIPTNVATLPILPGNAMYHLASMLGLGDPRSLLVVKARVVHHAILGGFYAAAAAVCATMINENVSSWDNSADAQFILVAVAQVVSAEEYDDVPTKMALCNGVFERDRGDVSVLDSQVFVTILDSFISLESSVSRCRQHHKPSIESSEQQGRASRGQDATVQRTATAGSDFLVFRAAGIVAKTAKSVARQAHLPMRVSAPGGSPQSRDEAHAPPGLIERVHHGILSDYSTDIHDLFLVLRSVSDSSMIDDPLLLTLGRLVGFWCISDALRMRLQSSPMQPDRTDFRNVLAIGASLLLHVQDRKALAPCISELQGILERETSAAMEHAALRAQPSAVMPNAAIVRRLVARGYSENGARRAAIMTGNESPEVALVWAVSHTLDDGFDDPMVVLAPPDVSSSASQIDQSMIHRLQETLLSANDYALGKKILESLLPAIPLAVTDQKSLALDQKGVTSGKPTGRTEVGANGDALRTVAKQPVSESHENMKSERASRQIPHLTVNANADETKPSAEKGRVNESGGQMTAAMQRATAPQDLRSTRVDVRTGASNIVGPVSAKPRPAVPPPKAKDETQKPRSLVSLSSLAKSGKMQGARPAISSARSLGGARQSGAKPSATSATSRLVVPPMRAKDGAISSPRPASSELKATLSNLDRASLRSEGQMTRQHTKSKTTSLESDERQRLITEGRRLLEQARASKGVTRTTRSSTDEHAATSIRYPLRSRLPVAKPGSTEEASAIEATGSSGIPPDQEPGANADNVDESADGWDFDDF